jgi:hypothetical protein
VTDRAGAVKMQCRRADLFLSAIERSKSMLAMSRDQLYQQFVETVETLKAMIVDFSEGSEDRFYGQMAKCHAIRLLLVEWEAQEQPLEVGA